ncbi:ribbon-helix-helix domain-containing protein [Dactylosporangium sp. AC04546]|uniref:ribbon-helix-helix domain-containing protein n=1 Tax=Dactylosporangium sp. AC04546 TaxID=2862460 RepID=UPI001EE0DFE0|nr:ribbon-helix-helix domain-containing protein [Dactylosporangium sp. AC04546]WVK86221.1 ribbon-helix-helix domain-containing protein [Dactylosporangium sp. AC04546]
MTTQIAVRLPDELIEYVDGLVASGASPSRAAVVLRAIEDHRRNHFAEQDARIYASLIGKEDPDDLDGLAAWGTTHPMGID